MLPESVKKMHADGLISDHHLEKLAEVQGRMIAASGKGAEAVVDVIVSEVELADFDEFDYEKCVSELESETEKTAAGVGHVLSQAGRWMGRNVKPITGIVGLGLLAGMGAKGAATAISNRRRRTQSLADIKTRNPELKKDKDTDRYFGVISEFAPSLARNSTVAGNLIQKMKQWGAIDHKTVQDLISMEKMHQDTNKGMSVMDAANLMANVTRVADFAMPPPADPTVDIKREELEVKRREFGLKGRQYATQRAEAAKRQGMEYGVAVREQELHPLRREKLEEEVMALEHRRLGSGI